MKLKSVTLLQSVTVGMLRRTQFTTSDGPITAMNYGVRINTMLIPWHSIESAEIDE